MMRRTPMKRSGFKRAPRREPIERAERAPVQAVATVKPIRRGVDICSVPGCESKSVAKTLCNKHYLRMKTSGSLELQPKKKRTAAEVLSQGSKVMENGCIEWQKDKREGYGRAFFEGRLHSAHVLAWEFANGAVPKGMQINHKCHNRACINTEHLYLGTQIQNMSDMRQAGREKRPRGSDFSSTKLNEVNVLAIRASKKSKAALARDYGVSESLIRAVQNRQVWAWVEDVALAYPKEEPLRSGAYRRLVSLLCCKFCGIAGHSQAAHPNAGKGAGTKTDDRLCFPLCADRPGQRGCHSLFDQGALLGKEARRAIEPAWGADTRRQITAMGLWPKNLPQWSDE